MYYTKIYLRTKIIVLNLLLYNKIYNTRESMYSIFIKLLFIIFIVTNTYSSKVEVLSDNIKQNIINLSLQL